MERERERVQKVHEDKAKESLLTKKDFSYKEVVSVRQSTDTASSHVTDGEMPNWSQCESRYAKYAANLKSERFQEPRMFTMEQIRNISFACLN